MNCQKYRREIEEAGRGAPAASEGAAAHAAACPACRKFADERARLRALLAGLEPVNAPDDFEFRLRARLAGGRGGGPRLFGWPRFAPGAALAAFAACCALAVGVALRTPTTTEERAARAPQRGGVEISRAGEASRTEAARADEGSAESSAAPAAVARVAAKEDEGPAVRRSRRVGRRAVAARREGKAVVSSSSSVAASREAGRQSGAERELTSGAGLETRESDFAAAQNFTVGEPIPVPVNPSAQQLKVVLRDEQGASRVVAINPVSFGAQEFVGPGGGLLPRAKQPPREGVW